MKIAFVGCGYVADFYVSSLTNYSQLELAGAFDTNQARLQEFCSYHGVRSYPSFSNLLEDPSVDLIVNLTPPAAHYEVTLAALEAGKHVFSEKPLAMDLESAARLAHTADERRLGLASAPSSWLSPAAQTLSAAVRRGAIGTPLLVYAQLDDGAVHQKRHRLWRSPSGAPWPAKNEFETGCTLEHGAYYLTWLTALFGPVRELTAVSACAYPDKETASIERMAPDISLGVLRFASGALARLTCTIVAPLDRTLRIVGERGVLDVDDAWQYGSEIRLRQRVPGTGPRPDTYLSPAAQLPLLKPAPDCHYGGVMHAMDFACGVQELVDSVQQRRPCRLSLDQTLHVLEVTLALQSAGSGCHRVFSSDFSSPQPMPWAEP